MGVNGLLNNEIMTKLFYTVEKQTQTIDTVEGRINRFKIYRHFSRAFIHH